MSLAGPSSAHVLTTLPITHPSFLPLFEQTSLASLDIKSRDKILSRINTAVIGRDQQDKSGGWRAASLILNESEEEGVRWGKGWIGSCLGTLGDSGRPLGSTLPALTLLRGLVLMSGRYPSFERDVVAPVMGKLALSLMKMLERSMGEKQWSFMIQCLDVTRAILKHSPISFKPVASSFRAVLQGVVLNTPYNFPSTVASTSTSTSPIVSLNAPLEVKISAAGLHADLYLTSGKAQAPTIWAGDMNSALGSMGYAMEGIMRDGFVENPINFHPPPPPVGLPSLPSDPSLRLSAALDILEGSVELILALLRVSTSRPVTLPLSVIIQSALRLLNLTLDTPIVSHVSPYHRAALITALPRLWTAGLLIIGGVMSSCHDHLLPYLSDILEHTVWLLEKLPPSMLSNKIQFLRFQKLLFTQYTPAMVPVDYPTRLLQLCLTLLNPLLETRSSGPQAINGHGGMINGGADSNRRKGKKRARDAEDGLIGSLEGRAVRPIGEEEAAVILSALVLTALLHPTPLLSPSLLTLSIRLHLSVHLRLPNHPHTIFADPSDHARVAKAVTHVLEEALLMNEGEGGTSRGWKSVILSVLPSSGEKSSLLLHPSVPPMMRPPPPLSALHFFAVEGEEETKLRKELGFGNAEDLDEDSSGETMDESRTQINGSPAATRISSNGLDSTLPEERPPLDQTSAKSPLAINRNSGVDAVPTNSRETRAASSFERPHLPAAPVPPSDPKEVLHAPSQDLPFISHSMTPVSAAPAKSAPAPSAAPMVDASLRDDSPFPELDSGSSIHFSDDDDVDEDDDMDRE